MTESLDILRKKLRFRAWHRGTKEADLMMGGFADAHLDDLDAEDLAHFSALLDESDLEVYGWVVGRTPVPDAHDTRVMKLLQGFDFTVEGLK
ncbi:MAG: succinate dehydrogenase assembly factor 2 [Alphaproteobacteria bacterium]|nr:succinate dehydrogenase assembly factor 2 [Alphaproteobacteria bacterium]